MNIVAFVCLYVYTEAHTINNNNKTISLWKYSIFTNIYLHNSLLWYSEIYFVLYRILFINYLGLM